MNPHFIFNGLNAIKGLIAKGNGKEARRSIDHFASIIRSVLNYSRDFENTIGQEIQFLEKYIELELLAHPEAFDYAIKKEENISENCKIPPMMVQPFVENAIKHGLGPLKSKGRLKVSFYQESDILYAKVVDNGVGRRRNQISQHRSHATKIIQDRIEALLIKAELEIVDNYEKGQKGTAVIIPLAKWHPDSNK